MGTEQKKLTTKRQKEVLLRLISYGKPYKKEIAAALLLLALSTLGEVARPYIIKVFLDDYIVPRNIDINAITSLAIIYTLILFTNAILLYIQSVKFQTVSLKIVKQIRIEVFTKVQSLAMRFFDLTPVGSIVSRVTNDTETIRLMFVSVFAIFIQSAFLFVSIFVAMFLLNMRVTALIAVVFPILYYIVKMYRKLSSKVYSELREFLSQLNAKLNESLQGMSIIQVFRQEKRLQEEFETINEKHYKSGIKNIKVNALLLRPAVDLVKMLATVIFIVYFGITSANTAVEIGALFALVNYLDRLFQPVNNAMQQLTFFQQAIVSASRVFDLLDSDELEPAQVEELDAQIKRGKATS